MREGYRLLNRVAETLDLGLDDDLFTDDPAAQPSPATAQTAGGPVIEAPLSGAAHFSEALKRMLGSTTTEKK